MRFSARLLWIIPEAVAPPTRAQRQASHLARRALPSTASQAAIQAERERTAQERASMTRQKKRQKAEEKRQLARLKAKARHRGH